MNCANIVLNSLPGSVLQDFIIVVINAAPLEVRSGRVGPGRV